MKKASSFLLFSNFNPQRFSNLAAPFISRSSSSSFSSTLHSTGLPLQTLALIFKLNQLQTNPSRNLCTLAEKPAHLPSTQRKQREKSDLEDAFRSAQTSEEMVRAFEDMEMEGCFDEWELGMASLKVAKKLDQEGKDPEKVLALAEKASIAFERHQGQDGKPSLFVAIALHLMSSASRSLKRFDKSECYSNMARGLLGKFNEGCDSFVLEPTKENSFHLKKISPFSSIPVPSTGPRLIIKLPKSKTIPSPYLEELVVAEGIRMFYSQRKLKVKSDLEKAFGSAQTSEEMLRVLTDMEMEGCFDERELARTCLKVGFKLEREGKDHEKAQTFAERALQAFAQDSKPSILTSMALHLLDSANRSLKRFNDSEGRADNLGVSSEWLRDDICVANMQIESGKYDEAINTLESVMEHTKTDSENRAMLFISMGKVLCLQEKFADSKRYLQNACEILDNKDTVSLSPIEVADAYVGISILYEKMNEFETAISLLKKTLVLLEKQPKEQKFRGYVSARIGQLLLLRGDVPQAIPYLDGAAERLKASFDSNHIRFFNMFCSLGTAYLKLDRPESAAEMFAVAKDVMDISLDPYHADSIKAFRTLSKAYSDMGSYDLAIEIQLRVINALRRHGPSAEDELQEAQHILEELKTKACGASHH